MNDLFSVDRFQSLRYIGSVKPRKNPNGDNRGAKKKHDEF